MADGIYGATSGAIATLYELESISANLANVSTTAYKSERLSFSEVLSRTGATTAAPRSTAALVKTDQPTIDLRQGALTPTQNSHDLALEGRGYMAAQDQTGPIFLRTAQVTRDLDGQLIDQQGRVLLGQNGRPILIDIEARNIQIDAAGMVRADDRPAGQLALVEFEDPSQLERRGEAVYAAPADVIPKRAQTTTVHQGYRERSNVNMVLEMSSMVLASRRYEALHRVISAFSEAESRGTTRIADE